MGAQATSSDGKAKGGFFAEFLHSEVSGSLVLMACTVLALAWANSPWSESYFDLAYTYVGFSFGEATFKLSFQHWINDGLMALFFFVVGLEVKRELVVGELGVGGVSTSRQSGTAVEEPVCHGFADPATRQAGTPMRCGGRETAVVRECDAPAATREPEAPAEIQAAVSNVLRWEQPAGLTRGTRRRRLRSSR